MVLGTVNFDTNYVFVSCVVFELCQFWIWRGERANLRRVRTVGIELFLSTKNTIEHLS